MVFFSENTDHFGVDSALKEVKGVPLDGTDGSAGVSAV